MKVVLFLILLLSTAVISEDGTTSEGSKHQEGNLEPINASDEPYQLQEGEEFVGEEFTVTVGPNGLLRTSNENKMEIKDGELINTAYTRRSWIDPHLKVQRVRKIIHSSVKIDSVYEVVKAFSEEYGKPLSEIEFELFNSIAITEGNHFHMNYIARQIKSSELSSTLRKMAKMFSVPLSEDDLAGWAYEIAQNCSEKYKVLPLDTAATELHKLDKWRVRSEVLVATCGQPRNAGFQLFAWAAYKEGAYKPGQYSVQNSETVDSLITRWLYANMRSMVDCERDDSDLVCSNEESSTISEYSITDTPVPHARPGDKWQEHGSSGNCPQGVVEKSNKPNLALSDKVVWNRNKITQEATQSCSKNKTEGSP